MKRFMMLLAAGSLVGLGLAMPSYGQFRIYTDNPNQPLYQQGQGGSFGNLVGSQVYDRDGNSLGTLSSIVTDPQSGQPIYGVITSGGILGFGSESHPVPWQLFSVSQNGVRLNLSEGRLRSSPSFSSNDRPNLLSDRWQRRIYDFYGTQSMGGRQGYGGSQSYGSGQDPFQRLFNRDDIENVSGTVTRVYRHMQGDLMQVSLRTDDGRSIVAVLAPEWYLESVGAEPRQGDNIRVRGSRVFQNGREFLVATSIRTGNQRLNIRDRNGTPLWSQQGGQGHYGGQEQYQYGY